jgi:hypothetical protein
MQEGRILRKNIKEGRILRKDIKEGKKEGRNEGY